MKDRVSTQVLGNGAIRYGIYNADGSLNRYEYIKVEDAPTEAGTLLNKASLLSDATASKLSLSGNPTVNDALGGIRTSGTATIPVANWTGTAAPYTNQVSIAGIVTSDNPQIACVLSYTDRNADRLIQEGWAQAVSAGAKSIAGGIIFYSDEKPTVSVPIAWEIVR